MLSGRVQRARAFAVEAHGDQKYGDKPYVAHLDEVADLVAGWGENAQVVAYLHDVVEDTSVTLDEVDVRFGFAVALCVDIVTDQPGATRRERKLTTYDRLRVVAGMPAVADAFIVKAADRLANVRNCVVDGNERLLRMYTDEHAMFREVVWRQWLNDDLIREIDELLTWESA